MEKNRYKAQALAIAMVVLVVSSIIAMSIYSRISKDKTLSIDERASAEALQISDLVLNYLTQYDVNEIITQAGGDISSTVNITLTENFTTKEISSLLSNLNSEGNITNLSICSLSSGTNSYFLNITEADETTFFEVRPGQIMGLPIHDITLGDSCTMNIHAVVRGDSQAGFSVTYTYGKNYDASGIAAEYKTYDEADVQNYCFSSDGTICNNEDFSSNGNWIPFRDDNSEIIPDINLKKTVDGYSLDEIKLTAIAGTVGFSYTIEEGSQCTDELKMIKIQAGANCDGVYRGKAVLLPEKQWESPIFNYVLFNGEGSL